MTRHPSALGHALARAAALGAAAFVVSARPLRAQREAVPWSGIRMSCPDALHDSGQLRVCIQSLFSDKPFHLAAQSGTVPSSGFGLGLAANQDLSGDGQAVLNSMAAQYTMRGFWDIADTLSYRPRVSWSAAHGIVDGFVRARGLKTLQFFGTGPRASHTPWMFGGREIMAGASARIPLAAALDAGIGAVYRDWRSEGGGGDIVPTRAAFTEAMLPGVSRSTRFAVPSLTLGIHSPTAPPFSDSLGVGYALFEDLSGTHLSFGRLTLEAMTALPLPTNQSLVVRTRATFSRALQGSAVPFYYEPTLGRADIEGREDLRGYDNYRFRGRDAVLGQVDYTTPGVPGHEWLRGLLFYDVGQVANSAADYRLSNLRHDVGAGFAIALANVVRARAWVAHSRESRATIGWSLSAGY